MTETAQTTNGSSPWAPRLKLLLGKGGLDEVGPEELLRRSRVLGAKRIGVHVVQGWLELRLDGLNAGALPRLTQGISNWVAIEHPRPYAMVLHVRTETVGTPRSAEVDAGLLLDLGGMGVSSAVAEFIWLEPGNASWAEQARAAFREAVQKVRQTGVRG